MTTNLPDRYAALRAIAAARKQETVQRLTAAIAALEARGDAVTVETIKKECGLAHTVYSRKRHPEAYALFRAHAAHFQPRPSPVSRRDRRPRRRRAPVRDPLLDQSKQELIALIHALEQDRDEAQAARDQARSARDLARRACDQATTYHLALADLHLHCEERIFHLERQLARIEKERRDLRATLLDQEHTC